MKRESCSQTSKKDLSSQSTLSGVDWWEERMKPFRQRNMDQSQRDRLARCLRALRRERFEEAQSGSIAKSVE